MSLPDVAILRRLGTGSTGTVYLARAQSSGELVAVKHLRAGTGDQVALSRFRQEAELMRAVEHPALVRIHSLEEREGECFLVMEYVAGSPLRDIISWVEPATGVVVVAHLAEALSRVHAAGIVHRDIKPANVLVTTSGDCKLADFGVARFVGDSMHGGGRNLIRTRTGTVLGSPSYLAPEIAGGATSIDHRADVYSLGIVAYRMLVGRLPFSGDTYALLQAHMTSPPPRPSAIQPGFHDGIERVLLRALAKDPADRYQTAAEFAEELTAGAEQAGLARDADEARTELAALVGSMSPREGLNADEETGSATDGLSIETLAGPAPQVPRAEVPVFRPTRPVARRLILVAGVTIVGVLVGLALVLVVANL